MKTERTTLDLNPVIRQFIEHAGSMAQSAGVGRVLGQIYAYLYFSPEPGNLQDLQDALGISKGSASTCVRQLEQWGAVRKIWVKGDRKDYYEATDWIGRILKNVVIDTVGKRMTDFTAFLDRTQAQMAELETIDGDGEFIRDRVDHLRRFHQRVQHLWNSPLLQRLLK